MAKSATSDFLTEINKTNLFGNCHEFDFETVESEKRKKYKQAKIELKKREEEFKKEQKLIQEQEEADRLFALEEQELLNLEGAFYSTHNSRNSTQRTYQKTYGRGVKMEGYVESSNLIKSSTSGRGRLTLYEKEQLKNKYNVLLVEEKLRNEIHDAAGGDAVHSNRTIEKLWQTADSEADDSPPLSYTASLSPAKFEDATSSPCRSFISSPSKNTAESSEYLSLPSTATTPSPLHALFSPVALRPEDYASAPSTSLATDNFQFVDSYESVPTVSAPLCDDAPVHMKTPAYSLPKKKKSRIAAKFSALDLNDVDESATQTDNTTSTLTFCPEPSPWGRRNDARSGSSINNLRPSQRVFRSDPAISLDSYRSNPYLVKEETFKLTPEDFPPL